MTDQHLNWQVGDVVFVTCPYCGDREWVQIAEEPRTVTHTCPVAHLYHLPPALRCTWTRASAGATLEAGSSSSTEAGR